MNQVYKVAAHFQNRLVSLGSSTFQLIEAVRKAAGNVCAPHNKTRLMKPAGGDLYLGMDVDDACKELLDLSSKYYATASKYGLTQDSHQDFLSKLNAAADKVMNAANELSKETHQVIDPDALRSVSALKTALADVTPVAVDPLTPKQPEIVFPEGNPQDTVYGKRPLPEGAVKSDQGKLTPEMEEVAKGLSRKNKQEGADQWPD